MPNNKEHINERSLVWGPETIPGPKWTKKLRVDQGTAAVITLDGAYRETLLPGGHLLAKYPIFTQCKVYRVDMKDRQLTAATWDELIIQKPAPVTVDLSTVVSYRVIEPRAVALEVSMPLGSLYDFVIEAMRDAVNRLHFEEFMSGGQASGFIFQHLQSRGLDQYLGIQILNAQVSSLTPDERVRQLMVEEGIAAREEQVKIEREQMQVQWQLQQQMDQAMNQRDIAKMLQLTPEYVALYLPEQYQNIFGSALLTQEKRLDALIELAKVGLIDPKALTAGSADLASALKRELNASLSAPSQDMVPQLEAGGESEVSVAAAERIQEECSAMRAKGYNVALKEEPGGYYYVIVQSEDHFGHHLIVYAVCTQYYPNDPPQVVVELDGEEKDFNSLVIENWTYKHTIMDIVNEVRNYYD